MTRRLALAAAVLLALPVAPAARAAPDAGFTAARALAQDGPRPAASVAELRAHRLVRARFAAAGLRVEQDTFTVPGRGRSRNVIGVLDGPSRCLQVVMAHIDTVAGSPGAQDNASGVGVLVGLAPRLRGLGARCDVWLVATGAEERVHTRQADHLGAAALVRRVRRSGLTLRWAWSLDEVGRTGRMLLRSSTRRLRPFERAVLRAAPAAGLSVAFRRDETGGLSDHREFQLAGLPAMKLGLQRTPCNHRPCDRASGLQEAAMRRVRRVVEAVLRS